MPLDDIAPGDRLLIREDDVVPVDGRVASATALLDPSALTGESLPVRLERDGEGMSGSTNAGDAFDLSASGEAKDGTYAGIVRLVEATPCPFILAVPVALVVGLSRAAYLGVPRSGPVEFQSQKTTVAARAMVERKTIGHRS